MQIVSESQSERIDWDAVAEKFNAQMAPETGLIYTAVECIMQFIKMPITDQLLMNFETQEEEPHKEQSSFFTSELASHKQSIPTVFMDASNPVISQVAIFARLLEMRDKKELPEQVKKSQHHHHH